MRKEDRKSLVGSSFPQSHLCDTRSSDTFNVYCQYVQCCINVVRHDASPNGHGIRIKPSDSMIDCSPRLGCKRYDARSLVTQRDVSATSVGQHSIVVLYRYSKKAIYQLGSVSRVGRDDAPLKRADDPRLRKGTAFRKRMKPKHLIEIADTTSTIPPSSAVNWNTW